jgi:hypothetical protein
VSGAGALPPLAGQRLQKDVRILAAVAEAAGVKAGSVLTAADAALESFGCPR